MGFKWNDELHETRVWDPNFDSGQGKESTVIRSHKSILNNPGGCYVENINIAICAVLSEFIEIEEKREEVKQKKINGLKRELEIFKARHGRK